MNCNGDIFVELRKLCKSLPTVANVNGVAEDIPKHFASIYRNLYNSVDDRVSLANTIHRLNEKVCQLDMEEVMKVTPELVKYAANHLKGHKSDPLFQFSSDCQRNAPAILFQHLACLFRFYLIHGHISDLLMLATLIPLVKDKMGDITSSNNYRSIAISSLVLKVLDWVIILLYGSKLQLDIMQFAYQPNCSTNMCTWVAIETIDYFTRNGSDIYSCIMDMTKAFDNVKHSTLFQKLVDKGLPEIYIRLIYVMYDNQTANVKWNGLLSKSFPLKNGVKQGAVLSAILYCVYVDDLFKQLRNNKSGCWINGMFYGIIGYADDLILLSPTLDGLQSMITTCGEYAKTHNLSFSTNANPNKCKTKCIAFLKSKKSLPNMKLNGTTLPWVSCTKHLGNKIGSVEHEMSGDLLEKRAQYINRNNELLQELYFAHPKTLIKVNNLYNTSFYGSPLWNLFGKEAGHLEKTWNISQRLMLKLHRTTHRYFIEPLSETKHITFNLYKRFIKFSQKLALNKKTSNLFHVIKNDCRCTTGYNLRRIMLKFGVYRQDEVNTELLNDVTYQEVPPGHEWEINMAKELIDASNGKFVIPSFSTEEISSILEHITTQIL